MIEPHQWIQAHAAALGIEHCVIGPCSVDLPLGGTIRAYNSLGDTVLRAGVDTPVLFQRGWFYLVATEQILSVPPTHCAFVHMRSSYARMGLGHKMAGLIDPGFEGQITLELETSINVSVPVGARIVQVTFHRLSAATEQPYSGHYQGQRGPTQARAPQTKARARGEEGRGDVISFLQSTSRKKNAFL